MTGKLFLDLGDDYAFDPRRAKAVAEGAPPVVVNPIPPLPIGGVDGPNTSAHGAQYWLQHDMLGDWFIWFDIDADPDPDIRQPLHVFLGNPAVDPDYRADVRARAEALGWQG